ncbi:uncharacterized protein N7498_010176 [Penicillium cinerascens]|uniref:DNA repair protein XRCC4 n=1 Tax=Penicillium cinerascens TaxID=70096 RepID=A0A9W9JBD7_9EURO|nr:uncharacterized protein N7498_010176 [Penicillium cinerascens]KAJ5191191.1 hypothetical protein N7498_010176 [Penicillium cinerascens]
MSPPRILRISRSDSQDAFVLVHVVNTGPAALDLTLTATEGECPYVACVKQSRLKDLCVKNYQGTEEEWARIVSRVLGQSTEVDELASTGIETTASISGSGDDGQLIIAIRNRVQSITQRLGTIVFKRDDEQAIELFEWSGTAASRADALQQHVTNLTNRYRVAEDTIQKLNEQLEELLRAKDNHESQLVANFAQLLNEKKLKVRNQQRLLASASADPAKVFEIQTATGNPPKAGESRHTSKRHAREMEQADGESDGGFEQMDVDENRTDDGSQIGPATDQATDEGTDNERQLSSQPATDDELDLPGQATQSEAASQQARAAPPRRELPFTRRDQRREEPSEEAEDTAGESDDDEL